MERAVEVTIFLVAALTIAGIVIAIAVQYDFGEQANQLQGVYNRSAGSDFERATSEQFAVELNAFWKSCKDGDEKRWLIEDEGDLTKERLFTYYKNLSWCQSIQSADFNCGTREDVEMKTFVLPRVVTATCNGGVLALI